MASYTKIGVIKKRKGLVCYEFDISYEYIKEPETEVFIRRRKTVRRKPPVQLGKPAIELCSACEENKAVTSRGLCLRCSGMGY